MTSEYGCADNECLDTCRNCVSDIDWDDYDGGQSNQCQCHNNGCDQCEDGWFKVDFDFPCQSCAGLLGCSHCTDFWGCQQCDEGYTMVEHTSCGEDSMLNTGNTKFHYCVPNDSAHGQCVVGNVDFNVGGDDDDDDDDATDGCPSLVTCDSSPCDCSTDANCDSCQSWGCHECADGWYKQSFGHECAECSSVYEGKCTTCMDWQGCTECAYGYTLQWNNDCGTNVCV